MATITLISPEDDATGVGNVIAGKAWVTSTFFIGDSAEPWGEGDCSGFEVYLDGKLLTGSYGWKSGNQSRGLGGLGPGTEHTWRVDIIVEGATPPEWYVVSSPTWSFTTVEPPGKAQNPTPEDDEEHIEITGINRLVRLGWEAPD